MSKLKYTLLGIVGLVFMVGCGPVVITSRVGNPPPPWFYPNRLEVVRYVYFPELTIYYDLTTRVYIYRDGGNWVRRPQLPPRYRNIDLRTKRFERIRNYQDEDIRRYHDTQRTGRVRNQ
ncbi:hypothetical protein [Robiginitalea sp. SC105]|uniref:hypothetical protein n=1 Tax=Robiginitalea sp. SC105 TaxID=2762332 RepID=UPI001639A31A|nr:hypothetical protein [Robiginitalea sp. SC105]MBC2840270.1 hypothetical protein [Robiginitalea sp. SC105]